MGQTFSLIDVPIGRYSISGKGFDEVESLYLCFVDDLLMNVLYVYSYYIVEEYLR